ncbi:hypothetical protein A0H81_10747 [Grifola frondosa]|uniref:Uncharacterized protein n=1 Tax=Grifola frondosa TaxID=5627 RepID=A0A1C7LWH2_GRIFR|nr:hypothetical protein A0H81_10747 [Grifola frondosa]
MDSQSSIIDVHTPSSSFSILHSNTEDTLQTLFEKLSKKTVAEFNGRHVRSGWVKYAWNDSIWNLDDESDYTIFMWRQKSTTPNSDSWPALHIRNPDEPLPRRQHIRTPPNSSVSSPRLPIAADGTSSRSARSRKSQQGAKAEDKTPKYKQDFEKFQSENGVRTVLGSIGPINNVRMLLRNGYRHIYMSRKFAIQNGFIPRDAAPGHYGYGGLVNLGDWPITVGRTRTVHPVYLSEESHFDVVLGRSFMERRQIKLDPIDPTDVVCMDTGEKIDCEVVILKDGKGQIVTVT